MKQVYFCVAFIEILIWIAAVILKCACVYWFTIQYLGRYRQLSICAQLACTRLLAHALLSAPQDRDRAGVERGSLACVPLMHMVPQNATAAYMGSCQWPPQVLQCLTLNNRQAWFVTVFLWIARGANLFWIVCHTKSYFHTENCTHTHGEHTNSLEPFFWHLIFYVQIISFQSCETLSRVGSYTTQKQVYHVIEKWALVKLSNTHNYG